MVLSAPHRNAGKALARGASEEAKFRPGAPALRSAGPWGWGSRGRPRKGGDEMRPQFFAEPYSSPVETQRC